MLHPTSPTPHPTLLLAVLSLLTQGTHAPAPGRLLALYAVLMLPWYFADKTMGVFHLQSPRKKYDFTYEQAQAACAAEGASLATFRQLSAAQQVRTGMERSGRGWLHCLVGWGHAVLLPGPVAVSP